MSNVNKHGLKRPPNSNVKRTIRQRSGFGCVVCGLAIGDYEHVDPTFTDAKQHDPDCMTFLCIRCHGKVTRGQLSKDSVKRAMMEPVALRAGFSFEAFDIGPIAPTFHIGPVSARDCESAIIVNSRPVLWVRPPEEDGGPVRIGAEMRNQQGELIFSIVDNEWRARTENWDVEVIGRSIAIRNGPGEIALVVRTEPPGDLFVDRMDMSIEGYRFWTETNDFFIRSPNGVTNKAEKLDFVGCAAAIVANTSSLAFGVGGGSVTLNMKGIGRTPRPIDRARRRNSPCTCGSGRRYKQCCGSY